MSFTSRAIRSLLCCEMSVEQFTLESMWKEIYICFDFALLVLLFHSNTSKTKTKSSIFLRPASATLMCFEHRSPSHQIRGQMKDNLTYCVIAFLKFNTC